MTQAKRTTKRAKKPAAKTTTTKATTTPPSEEKATTPPPGEVKTPTPPKQDKTPVEVSGHFTINGKPQFWNNKIFMPGKGVISGAVTVEDKKAFFAASPNSDLSKWMSDFDPVQKRVLDAKAKMRRKVGLD